ncbi:MAG: hypothetical protein ACXAEE_09220 [Candidatus Thorarchaeota archaeon]
MHRRKIILMASFIVSLFILLGTVSAQASLVANITRENEHLWYTDPNDYVAELEVGHWTVVVNRDSFSDIEVIITVATDSSYTNVIAESGTDYGHYPRVDFDLASASTVYIRVAENSVYSDTSGFYRIGVYDDSHIPGFFESLSFFELMMLIMVLAFLIPLFICIFAVRRSRRTLRAPRRMMDSILVEAPMHVIPDEHQGSVQTHGSRRTTTVRLPVECPSCGAQVSHENVDWTGPLEAQCGYCSATMRATFENI